MAALGASSGALLGGVMTQAFGWPAIFIVNLPLGALIVALARRAIPATPARGGKRRFDAAGATLITAALVGVTYGIAESGRLAVPGGTPVVAFWPRPWGFGFGFFPIFPLLFFLFFWVFVARALFWRGRWHRGYGNRWETRGVPPMFEEWHRRMHEQQPQQPPPAARS